MSLQAATMPKKRRPTRPSRGSKERRIQAKKRRATIKTGRRISGTED
jgi:ribosome-associated protein